jgi:phosphoribosylglycinamide formyltransferase 1
MNYWFKKKKVVSFLVSGSGLNFNSVAKKIISKDINATIGVVVTDNSTARVLARAKELGIAAFFVDPGCYPTKEEYEDTIIQILKSHKTDLIVAAGYMRLLTHYFVDRYQNRIINIHPSLLPSFPGIHGAEKALEYGVKITGCTAHFVDAGIDTGPIIMQSPIPVIDNDTVKSLSARILNEEYRVLSDSIKLFCEGRLQVVDNKVIQR